MIGTHAVEPAADVVPTGHVVQPHAPVVAENVPAGHCEHVPEPPPENVPAAHAEQVFVPPEDAVPQVHCVHTPGVVPVEPAGHDVQKAAPALEEVPTGHWLQDALPENGVYVPAGQATHCVLPKSGA